MHTAGDIPGPVNETIELVKKLFKNVDTSQLDCEQWWINNLDIKDKLLKEIDT